MRPLETLLLSVNCLTFLLLAIPKLTIVNWVGAPHGRSSSKRLRSRKWRSSHALRRPQWKRRRTAQRASKEST